MAIRHGIRHNLEEVAKDLSAIERTQLPFAIATALTRTAGDVRDELRATLRDHFTVRSTWVERSIQSEMANKKDVDPTARVGSTYLPMGLHDVGGEKTGRKGSVGVPVGARENEEDVTKPNSFPNKLLQRPNTFIAPFDRKPFRIGSGSETGVFERIPMPVGAFGPVARGVTRRKRSKAAQNPRFLKLWWTIEEHVKIKAEWPFERTGIAVADAALIDHFWAAMEMAMRTRRVT